MENLIYIIIGIAWVAYSVYSARQKAIQKQQTTGLPPRGPSQSSPLPIPGNPGGGKSVFDDILRELTGESRPVPQVIKPDLPAKPDTSYKPVHSKNVSELNVTYEGHTGYKFITGATSNPPLTVSENITETHEKYQHLTKDEGISKKINLREAVIFSELLNPKYF